MQLLHWFMDSEGPSEATLKKYGITREEWQLMYDAQGGACAICAKAPPSGRLNIDHEHAKGWKKMAPEQRKQYVRGLLCWTCNLYILGRGVTLARLENAVRYLKRFTLRGHA
jgi:hypothetical protein